MAFDAMRFSSCINNTQLNTMHSAAAAAAHRWSYGRMDPSIYISHASK